MEIFVFNIYQSAESQIQQADVLLDIGANVGFFALYASQLNSHAEIHAFEPFPKNCAQINRNLSLNPDHRIRVYSSAVADKTGTATLYFNPGDDSGCSLNQPKGHSCVVETVGINDLFAVCKVTKCDLLKMDCEGSELGIVSAMSDPLLKKIGGLIMEYHHSAELPAIKHILVDSGFNCEVLPQISTLHACKSQPLSPESINGQGPSGG